LDGKVRSADAEYKVPRESRFRVTTKLIYNLVLVVPVEEQTMEETEDEQRNGEEADAQRDFGDSNSGEEVRGEKLGQEDSVQIGPNQTTPDEDELRKIDRGGMPDEEGDSGEQKESTKVLPASREGLRVTVQDAAEEIRDVNRALKRGRGRPQKMDVQAGEDRQEAISPGPGRGSVFDRGVGCCLEPKGNGTNLGEGNEGGPAPPPKQRAR
jgi:hypothetical protein